MISVLSHQRLLSGSKYLLAIVLIFALGSCGTTEKATSKRSNTKRSTFGKKKRKSRKPKVDTIQWSDVDITDKQDRTRDKMAKGDRKSHYNVSMIIPLDAKSYMGEGTGNERMIQYYAGIRMALDQLDKEGANLTLNVIDESKGGSITTLLREAQSASADIIVGPYDKSDLKRAADFARKEEITLVSPWIALSSKSIEDNPYFVQLKPSTLDHYQRMIEHVSEHHNAEDVVLLCQEGNRTDKNRAKYIQTVARAFYRSSDQSPLKEYYIPADSLRESRMLFYDYLAPEETSSKTKVFLIPNMNSKDENFIYGAIRRLTAERGNHKIVVYGMPIVLDSDKLTFDNYNATATHVVSSNFVDQEKPAVKAFRQKYYDRYGALPQDEAYEGYDMMIYIGRALMEHGTTFQYHMNKDYNDLLQSTIAIFPKQTDVDESYTKDKDIEYFANKNVDIIHFRDFRFQKKY